MGLGWSGSGELGESETGVDLIPDRDPPTHGHGRYIRLCIICSHNSYKLRDQKKRNEQRLVDPFEFYSCRGFAFHSVSST